MYKRCEIANEFNIEGLYTLFKQTFKNAYSFEGEEHNFWEVVCVTHGSVGVTAGSDLCVLTKGQAVIHKPGEFHNLWSESNDSEVIIFSFDGSLPDFDNRIYCVTDDTLEEIFSDAEKCFYLDGQNVNGVVPGKMRDAQFVLKKLELFMMKLMSNDDANALDVKTKSAINYMNIVSALSKHIDENVKLKDIAKYCNMSESSVKKIFKKYSGVGVMHYFNALKIKKAQTLLENGYSVKETSDILGFTDQNYFSVVFKRLTGKPPVKCKK